ncbi:oxygen-independent coproporphyrinogen III oxidase-like protein [Curvibacter sp. CHRR-16]|uniref:radical SAM family heme chaperone HemW n=1 Tax=Curvibacter sp. CHRR-16 TaxID=2835872 RepID=UPI001BD99368|nr:radical SAM family heme chaperone HemW [Curvibacter sp. CHRR-16]MBT0570896.1 oxygen-independent coproporphyrinogen III oxidase-like protein [Curvibacter sp. CHRR-16]
MQDIQHYMRPGALQLTSLPPLSLYIHLPWCLRKCPYCDFNSHELSNGLDDDLGQRYVQALVRDLESSLPMVWGRTVQTIFIGGGTPSLLSPHLLDQLLADVRARIRLAPDCEITLEANPGTFERDRFRAFRQAGVTRLSVGVQSFNDDFLRVLGRVHNKAQALAALEEAAQAFDTFNIDLMYALPGQTREQLKADVNQALQFSPPHLSVYHLTIEPNTYFAKFPPVLPDEDIAYDMLDDITALTGQSGLQRYEVSAYARAGHQCQHNLNYWQFGDYLGIGAGAHGKLSFAHRVVRQVRLRDPMRYLQGAEAGNAVAQEDEVAREDLAFEFMLNALRLREGFAVQDFVDRTGLALTRLEGALQQAESQGLIERDWKRIRPTDKGFDFLSDLQGLFLSNSD